jgi:hypothetical protein
MEGSLYDIGLERIKGGGCTGELRVAMYSVAFIIFCNQHLLQLSSIDKAYGLVLSFLCSLSIDCSISRFVTRERIGPLKDHRKVFLYLFSFFFLFHSL